MEIIVFKDYVYNKMKNLVNLINANVQIINNICPEIYEKTIIIKSNRYNIKRSLVSILLATSILLSGGAAIGKIAKKKSIDDKYLETKRVYSTITDETITETREIFSSMKPKDSTIVMVYDSYEDDLERTYQCYDVSYLNFDTPYEYYAYGVDNFKNASSKGVLNAQDNDTFSDYRGSYSEVIDSTYKYIGRDINKEKNNYYLFILYVIFLTIFIVIERITYGDSIIIDNIRKLFLETINLISNKIEFDNYDLKAEDNIDNMLALIKQNDKLKSEFDELFEANKYLLDNPEELYRRVNNTIGNVSFDDVKKLVKGKK